MSKEINDFNNKLGQIGFEKEEPCGVWDYKYDYFIRDEVSTIIVYFDSLCTNGEEFEIHFACAEHSYIINNEEELKNLTKQDIVSIFLGMVDIPSFTDVEKNYHNHSIVKRQKERFKIDMVGYIREKNINELISE